MVLRKFGDTGAPLHVMPAGGVDVSVIGIPSAARSFIDANCSVKCAARFPAEMV
jgi:hypothetical protein